jgi:carboxymethylenebutenolidase
MSNNEPVQSPQLQGITQIEIDQRVYDLYDEYCHGRMSRRDFLSRAASLVVVAGSGLAMAQALLPRYAQAQTISFTDQRIKANYVTFPSPGGSFWHHARLSGAACRRGTIPCCSGGA